MKLLIVSNMPHYRAPGGGIVGWGPTVEEINHLATRFDRVRHVACLHEGAPPASYIPYSDRRISLVPVRPTGGDTLRSKLEFLAALPGYTATIHHELRNADMVHLRCPANLPMIAATLLPFLRSPPLRWLKYAGDWRPPVGGSIPFAYQRWLLAKPWHRGIVTVNGRWADAPAHVLSFYNPSLESDEVATGALVASTKLLTSPIRLLFVGRLWAAKGCATAIDALHLLTQRGIAATLDVVGDGDEREAYESRCRELGLEELVTFQGWLPREEIAAHYTAAHFILFPTRSEGWPKVLSEGMAYGAVPITSAVGAISQYLADFKTGVAIRDVTAVALADAIASYKPAQWIEEMRNGLIAAQHFSYDRYLEAVDGLLEIADR